MQEEAAAKRVGTWLRDKYRLDAVIGVGGMASVYSGAHRNGNRVAVKVLHTELSVSTDVRARFLKEGYVANAVEHPGVVRVLDDDVTADGAVFLVMELLEGETLEKRWRNADCALPAREVAEHAVQVLAVLAAAHKKGIIHRDIKPENLFLENDGSVKVLDFGIARMRDAAGVVTRTGRMMGTPAYMPPEQALGLIKDIDARTDLWALGATMFSLIAGKYVHEAETPEMMVVLSATKPARSLASIAPAVPAGLVAVIDRALSFERDGRHADAAAMLAALEAAQLEAFGVSGPGRSVPRIAPSSPDVAQDKVKADKPSPPAGADLAPTEPAAVTGPTAKEEPAAKRSPAGSEEAPATLESAPRISMGVASTLPARVSTTSGVSSSESAALRPTDSSPAQPITRRPWTVVAGIVAALALFGLGARTLLVRPGTPSPAVSALSPEPKQAGIATATATALATASAASASAPASSAMAAESAAPAAATVPARPTTKRDAGAPATVKPAVPDCNPPIYYDPATGQKKVKPGC